MQGLSSSIKVLNDGLFMGMSGSVGSSDLTKPTLPVTYIFETSGRIDRVPNSSRVHMILIGGGASGGSGACYASGTAAGGGGGGGGAGYSEYWFLTDMLVFPLYVEVGAGGIGPAGRTTVGNGTAGNGGGGTTVLASGINDFRTESFPNLGYVSLNRRVAIAGGAGNWQVPGGGTNTVGGAVGQGINNSVNYASSWLGTNNGLAGGFPSPSNVGDASLNWVVPKGGGGGGGISSADAVSAGGSINSNSLTYYSINMSGLSSTNRTLDAPVIPYLPHGGWSGAGGDASLTTGGRGGHGFRGGGGGGGGAGRTASGAGGNGGNGVAIITFW